MQQSSSLYRNDRHRSIIAFQLKYSINSNTTNPIYSTLKFSIIKSHHHVKRKKKRNHILYFLQLFFNSRWKMEGMKETKKKKKENNFQKTYFALFSGRTEIETATRMKRGKTWRWKRKEIRQEENRSCEKPRGGEGEELNPPKNFSPLLFSLFRGEGTRGWSGTVW